MQNYRIRLGGKDEVIIELNELAFKELQGGEKNEIILGATHLFDEGGTLEQVAKLAVGWFQRHL